MDGNVTELLYEFVCYVPVHPYNDENVIAGQGTVALEIFQDMDQHILIIVWMDGNVTELLYEFVCFSFSLINRRPAEHDLSSISFGCVYLGGNGIMWHDDRSLDTKKFAGKCDALTMVP